MLCDDVSDEVRYEVGHEVRHEVKHGVTEISRHEVSRGNAHPLLVIVASELGGAVDAAKSLLPGSHTSRPNRMASRAKQKHERCEEEGCDCWGGGEGGYHADERKNESTHRAAARGEEEGTSEVVGGEGGEEAHQVEQAEGEEEERADQWGELSNTWWGVTADGASLAHDDGLLAHDGGLWAHDGLLAHHGL